MVDKMTPSRIWNGKHKKARVRCCFCPFFPWRRRLLNRVKRRVFYNALTSRREVCMSKTIGRPGLERIDLLQIDVEGAELEVLHGIEEQHWQRIQQVAMEIDPWHKGALTVQGLRAGLPTIVVPFFYGQYFSRKRAFDLGVGSRPIPRNRVDAEVLATGLRAVTANPGMRRQGAALAKLIRREDGVTRAAYTFEHHMRRPPSTSARAMERPA